MDREPDRSWWQEARAVARRYARGASDAADDLAQELALAALERGGVDARRPGAWIERVGRNAAIDRWRVERRRRELAAEIFGAGSRVQSRGARPLAGAARRGSRRAGFVAAPAPSRDAGALPRQSPVRRGGVAPAHRACDGADAGAPRARVPARARRWPSRVLGVVSWRARNGVGRDDADGHRAADGAANQGGCGRVADRNRLARSRRRPSSCGSCCLAAPVAAGREGA